MSSISKLIRPELKEFESYTLKRDVDNEAIWLDHNESPWNELYEISIQNLNRYPNQQPKQLFDQLATLYEVAPSQIVCTRGSDEGIDLLVRLFCRPYQDSILISPPTFSMYGFFANLQGAKVIEAPLEMNNDFSWCLQRIYSELTENTKLIFICSPNNPTGNCVPIEKILQMCEMVKDQSMVVVDEAYIEFAENKSVASYTKTYENLIVLRTFSKAYGLAGLRFGVMIANEKMIKQINKVMPPYPFCTMALSLALNRSSLQAKAQMRSRVEYLCQQRQMMFDALSRSKLVEKVFPSCANFLLAKVTHPQKTLEHCAQNKIHLRDLSATKYLDKCVRISIGLQEQNQSLLRVFENIGFDDET